MITITHAETVAYYPEQFSEPCRIVATGWPYDCDAKRASPGHEVFTCEPHRVWWHRAPGQAHDFRAVPDAKYPHLHNPQCSCGWRASGYVKLGLAIEKHRQHAGQREKGCGNRLAVSREGNAAMEAVGYWVTCDDAVCAGCAPEGFASEDYSAWAGFEGWESPLAIFSDDESDSPSHCSACGALVSSEITTRDGWQSVQVINLASARSVSPGERIDVSPGHIRGGR